MSCDFGRRPGLNLALLWLWCRPAAAALIQPLAWERPYAAGAALKKKKIKNKLCNDTLIYVYVVKGPPPLSWLLHASRR